MDSRQSIRAYSSSSHRDFNAHHITSHHLSYCIISSHHITSHHITSHHILPYHISSHDITSPYIVSHRIASHHITSHVSTTIPHILSVYDTADRGSVSLDQSMCKPSPGTEQHNTCTSNGFNLMNNERNESQVTL
jgi:hypothetical protein